MGWVKLDQGFFRHPKALAAGPDGRFLYVAALCWAGQYNTDGQIPHYALEAVAPDAGLLPTEAATAADRLVEVGLWAREPDGWRVHGWDEWQTTAVDRERERERWRDRKQRSRERHGGVTAESRRSHPVTPAEEVEVEVEVEVVDPPPQEVLYRAKHVDGEEEELEGDETPPPGQGIPAGLLARAEALARQAHDRAVAAGRVKHPELHLAACLASAVADYGPTLTTTSPSSGSGDPRGAPLAFCPNHGPDMHDLIDLSPAERWAHHDRCTLEHPATEEQ